MTSSTSQAEAVTSSEAYLASLARKRMAAGVLFFDAAGRVLLVEPVYKKYWEIPGGAVEADESPQAAACREPAEELGIDVEPGRLLAVDYVPARPGRTEGVILIFDGGQLTGEQVAAIRLPAGELGGYAFVDEAKAAELLSPLLARRLSACLRARQSGETVYLENGTPVG